MAWRLIKPRDNFTFLLAFHPLIASFLFFLSYFLCPFSFFINSFQYLVLYTANLSDMERGYKISYPAKKEARENMKKAKRCCWVKKMRFIGIK